MSKNAVILFGDDVHPTMATKVSLDESKKIPTRQFETTASRTFINLVGAINLYYLSVTSNTHSTINSESISNFLGKLKNVSPENKIHLVLDQRSYNKSKETLKKASDLDIEIHHLPFYGPNFELIHVYLQF